MAHLRSPCSSHALAVLLASSCAPWCWAQPALPSPPSNKTVEADDSGERVVTRRATSSQPATLPEAAPSVKLPRSHHPWARFEPGAWRRLRITSESFDVNGRFLGRSSTTQTETLRGVDEETFTLEVISIVEIGGKRLRGAAQTVIYALLCDEPCDRVAAERLDKANISLDGAVAPVERWRLRYGAPGDERTEVVCYSPDRSPYILRRERTLAVENAGEAPSPAESTMSITRVDAPLLIDGGIVPASHATIVTRKADSLENRFEVRCDAVPGGLVTASSTERDASGRRVRWSTIELESYGEAGQGEPQPGEPARDEPTTGDERRWKLLDRLRQRGT